MPRLSEHHRTVSQKTRSGSDPLIPVCRPEIVPVLLDERYAADAVPLFADPADVFPGTVPSNAILPRSSRAWMGCYSRRKAFAKRVYGLTFSALELFRKPPIIGPDSKRDISETCLIRDPSDT